LLIARGTAADDLNSQRQGQPSISHLRHFGTRRHWQDQAVGQDQTFARARLRGRTRILAATAGFAGTDACAVVCCDVLHNAGWRYHSADRRHLFPASYSAGTDAGAARYVEEDSGGQCAWYGLCVCVCVCASCACTSSPVDLLSLHRYCQVCSSLTLPATSPSPTCGRAVHHCVTSPSW